VLHSITSLVVIQSLNVTLSPLLVGRKDVTLASAALMTMRRAILLEIVILVAILAVQIMNVTLAHLVAILNIAMMRVWIISEEGKLPFISSVPMY
jgi:hypothetical protein